MLGCSAFAQGVTDAPAERQFASLGPVGAVGSGPEAGKASAGCPLVEDAFSIPFLAFWNALKQGVLRHLRDLNLKAVGLWAR
jgi:hypothetical protein